MEVPAVLRGTGLTVIWTEDQTLRAGSGHGVDFFWGLPSDETVAAHIVGFDWLHGQPESVEVRIRAVDQPSSDSLRVAVQSYLASRGPISLELQEISPGIYVYVNG